ncbi:MAG: pirin family protein [Prevotellaceae bacterium]|jgi:redox-sensitive bicupin YhaK (pirin superfamily)|nr:pirin family protein [Prevotellaceae bacterium]
MSKQILHTAESRGHFNHGWLNTYHTFSFADYHDAERVHFGALRVLNDDTVAAGEGFGMHPHADMEVISIPLAGDLEHKDSLGHVEVIRHGEVQTMSAGTGIRHSEYNKNQDSEVKFLQIWVFPDRKGHEPRYDSFKLDLEKRHNRLQQVVSPNADDEGAWIYQKAWFYMSKTDKDVVLPYTLNNKDNGVYAFVLEGEFEIDGQTLKRRDGLGIWETDGFNIKSLSDGAEILLMEVPM